MLITWDGKKIKTADFKLNDESFLGIYHEFEKGIINANNVNFRAEPSSSATIISTLIQYEYVEIDSVNCKADTVNRKLKYWHRIKYKDSTGFVYSDFLDILIRYIKSNMKENESFLYTNKSLIAFVGNEIVGRYKLHPSSYYGENFYNYGSKGLHPNYRFLSLHRISRTCGGWNGDEYYLWDGKEFKFFGNDGGSGEISYFEYNSYIFPEDYGGLPNKVITHQAYFENPNFTNNICESSLLT